MLSTILAYGWILIVLVFLEGLLSADNAIVMAVMVKHLNKEEQKKALFYGLLGAVVLRFGALFLITILVELWWIQALGAAYLLYVGLAHTYKFLKVGHDDDEGKQSGDSFWVTVIKVNVADLAFAIDSMLAAVAIAVTLPKVGDFTVGGINGGQFAVMFIGGIMGIILMRYAANAFIKLLADKPGLELSAFLIVAWVGVKLVVLTLAHEAIHILPHDFPHSFAWGSIFWSVLLVLLVGGYAFSDKIQNYLNNK